MDCWKLDPVDTEVRVLSSGREAVVVIPLRGAALTANVLPSGSWLVVHMNPHPRPSFALVSGLPKEVVASTIVERFGFGRIDALGLADAILSTT